MVKAKSKQKGTTWEDIFNSVPVGSDFSQSARYIWTMKFTPDMISYDTFNRMIGKLAIAEYEGKPIIKYRESGVSKLYWRDLEKFPNDLRFI